MLGNKYFYYFTQQKENDFNVLQSHYNSHKALRRLCSGMNMYFRRGAGPFPVLLT